MLKTKNNKQETICWECAKACGECPWSDGSFTPVDGWVATPTKVKCRYKIIDSYLVEKCPLFISDAWTSIYVKPLAKLLNVNWQTFYSWTDEYKISKARQCGYELRFNESTVGKRMYIRKVE